MNNQTTDIDVVKLFYDGIWGSDHYKRLGEIGDELDKVRLYANERVVEDKLSLSIVYLTASSYFSGLVPIIRIESALFVEKELRNEYAYALAVRAYIEIAGRVHKGMRLWRQYKLKTKTLEDLHFYVSKLMAKFQPKEKSTPGMFKGNGFNVMTLVDALDDKLSNIKGIYENLSGYIHGGFEEQMFWRKTSWVSEIQDEPNPVIAAYEATVKQLRSVIFEDFEELLQITHTLRERYDNDHKSETGC